MADNHNASPFAVDDPEIAEVLDMRTGLVIPAHEAIGSDYDQAMALRMELGEARARSEPVYVCPLCGTPVYLVSRKETSVSSFDTSWKTADALLRHAANSTNKKSKRANTMALKKATLTSA